MIRVVLAIAVGRLAGRLSRLFGRGGSAIPGLVAERIEPRTIERLASSIPEGVVVVTGTNGKTTTTKMLVSIMEAGGKRVLTNRSGSNLERGVASALIAGSSWRGEARAHVAVFEADEAAVRRLGPPLRPRLMVVTNLARDQLDRYGELDTAAGHIAAALEHVGEAVLNADDPLVAGLGGPVAHSTFGAVPAIRLLMPSDRALHDPDAADPGAPGADAVVTSVRPEGADQTAVIRLGADEMTVRLRVPGVYNAYNAAAAALAAVRLGAEPSSVVSGLEAMEPPFGRGQVIDHRGRRIAVLLVKNPAGFNQAIRVLADVPESVSVLVAINDNHADGRDVSWLWDSRVEDLAATNHRFAAGGVRAADMALRFKYAGIDAWAEPDLGAALDRIVEATGKGDTVYVVPTYTAMLALLDLLLPGVPRREVWT